jgi:hypothetical protein
VILSLYVSFPQKSSSITNNGKEIESKYVIENSTGANNGTYSCKAVYTMNKEEFPGKLLSTKVFVEGMYVFMYVCMYVLN